jgi:2-oxoglutarate ferredoxin oxidoreductase subunit gamma
MINQPAKRTDIKVINVPINEIAKELGSAKVGNMVMLGALIRSTIIVSEASIEAVMKKMFTGEKARLNDLNMKAFMYTK